MTKGSVTVTATKHVEVEHKAPAKEPEHKAESKPPDDLTARVEALEVTVAQLSNIQTNHGHTIVGSGTQSKKK